MSTKNDTNQSLNDAIAKLLVELDKHEPTTTEYANLVDQLDKLYKIKATDKPDRVSKDALITVLGSIAGIVSIIGFERANVLSSKALGFVLKAR